MTVKLDIFTRVVYERDKKCKIIKLMKLDFFRDFVDFVREQGVVGLAVGFVLGAAVKDVVSAFVDNIVNPLVGIFLKNTEGLKEATFTIASAEIMWGAFLATLIDFLIIAFIVYYFIKALSIAKFDKKKE